MKRSVLAGSVSALTFALWELWRHLELKRLRRRAEALLREGYLLVDSIAPARKASVWRDYLLPRLISHWESLLPNFNIEDTSTWPMPENGRAYETSLRSEDSGASPLKVFSSNYEVQAVIAYLFDPDLRLVSFDRRSHWKFWLLTHSPSSWIRSSASILISGTDQSWHLMNWPNPRHGAVRTPILNNAHIDAGESSRYFEGLPTPDIPISRAVEPSSDRLLSMLLWQLGILFFCDTPGELGEEEGATGFYPGTHISILEGILLRDRSGAPLPIDFEQFRDAVKLVGEKNEELLKQVSLPDGKALLAFGTLAHTLMWAVEPMRSSHYGKEMLYPRSIQNCKIKAVDPLVLRIGDLGKGSLLRELVLSPIDTYARLESDATRVNRVEKMSRLLFQYLDVVKC